MRDRFLRGAVMVGAAVVAITEGLGAFEGIRFWPMAVCWIAFAMCGFWLWNRFPTGGGRIPVSRDPQAIGCVAAIGGILALTAITALASPPNSADAMAYHLPRVVYWAEMGSVRFFPTPYLNQIMLQPLAEYCVLQTFVLTGGDHLANLVQWAASLTSIVGVSAIAGEMGAGARGQALAALFCATLPAGILASSGAKNDYVLAACLVAMVYFALRLSKTRHWGDALFLGAALGLALLTKGTAYLFAPWVLAALVARHAWPLRTQLAIAAGVALVLNAPQAARNLEMSGSPLGFDSAQGDGRYRWRNETFGWKQTVSNALRNTSDQLAARREGWNQAVYGWVLDAHRRLGIDVNDPATTWPLATFGPPLNANHEANAPNRVHLVLLLLLAALAALMRDRARAIYALALLAAFLSFCAYLKWQPFFGRLLLPLFVLASPVASGAADLFSRRPRANAVLACGFGLLLLDSARAPVFENWVRPLKGPRSVLRVPREAQYFADMNQWNNAASYRQSADLLVGDACATIGIDITNLQLEYPLQALVRERKPGARFLHTGVGNASSRYRPPVEGPPCAVVCLDCEGDPRRLSLYADFTRHTTIGKFAILRR